MAQADAGGRPENDDGQNGLDDFFVDGEDLLDCVENNRVSGRAQVRAVLTENADFFDR